MKLNRNIHVLLFCCFGFYIQTGNCLIPQKQLKDYDFIIIGGGTAGSVVASRLTEDEKVRVLVLEAGTPNPTLDAITEVPEDSVLLTVTDYDWQYMTEPQEYANHGFINNSFRMYSGKVLGGSSSTGEMVYVRGSHRNYDLWASMGNEGWDFENVLKYFKKSEDQKDPVFAADTKYHGTGGYLTVTSQPLSPTTGMSQAVFEAAQEFGYPIVDTNGASEFGCYQPQYTISKGRRCSTAKAFLDPVLHRPNLVILQNSTVSKILFDKGNRAYGVLFSNSGTEYEARATREVILCAGTMRSPQILMLSGVGPQKHLKDHGIQVVVDVPGVGENFHEQPATNNLLWTVENTQLMFSKRMQLQLEYLQWFLLGKGVPAYIRVGENMCFLKSNPDDRESIWSDINIALFQSTPLTEDGNSAAIVPNPTQDMRNFLTPLNFKSTFGLVFLLTNPRSRGNVYLKSQNINDHPAIDPKLLSDPDDRKQMTKMAQFVINFTNTEAFKKFNIQFHSPLLPLCPDVTIASVEYLECLMKLSTSGGYHTVGTCKMGPLDRDPMAVVDPELRVRGVTGLRVIDASIMPVSPSSFTLAATIMIGEKGADIIKQSYGLK